jgi:oxygen-independent coproporphyrinogen-3 oxidase
MTTETPDIVRKHAGPVPRYTSYPTAPHFSSRVGEVHYVSWLADLRHGARLSLYVHIPFCHSLCWYCGCNTRATQRYAPIAGYLPSLLTELANVAALVPPAHRVTHIHWGGGSPNILSAADIRLLAAEIRNRFDVAKSAEFAVEIDPRRLRMAQVETFADAGVTRVSIGVQDFDRSVQAAIGRLQSFADTERCIDAFRRKGVRSINIDLVYGLPHQTLESLERTLGQVLALAPDRIAAFGYAHIPERLKHQRLIPQDALPGDAERYAQSRCIIRRLEERGYVRIGLDHFARPGDPLALASVQRNFQGYTTDDADALIGLGASAISRLPQGYAQNATAVADYTRRIRAYGLATAKGFALGPEDRMRARIIERLMCELGFSATDLRRLFGAPAEPLIEQARALVAADGNGLVEATPDGFAVTERGRPFVRSICARFDAYLGTGHARHSRGV